MGRDKKGLPFGSGTMLERIAHVAGKLGPVRTVVKDSVPNEGPLTGVLTALEQSSAPGALFLSCDMPLVSERLLRDLVKASNGQSAFTIERSMVGFPFFLPRSAVTIVREQLRSGQMSLQKLAAALGAREFHPAERQFGELLNVNTPKDYERAKSALANVAEPIIEIEGMVIRRGKVVIVRDLNWRVAPGEHWAILGANGSGKTSLLSAITGYLTPTEGRIRVLGQEYGESDWRELRKKVGIVSSAVRQMMGESEPALHTVASGSDAVIDSWGPPKRKDAERARAILEDIECSYLADRPWAVLSQGERQRVLIGRALMGNPALLILDEPCAGLDPAAREHFLQFLERLGSRASGPCLTLVTHHVEDIVGPFSKVLLLKNGSALATGATRKMLTNELLSETFSSPVRVFKRKERFFLEVDARPSKII